MSIEKREHTRVYLPFQVEISHSSIGCLRTTASNISEGGIFVEIDNPQITDGAIIHLTILSIPLIESPPTPSIKMIVSYSSTQGLGLKFATKTSQHLWESVKRARNSLIIGEDYFQIYQNALIVNPSKELLLVQQSGKWLLPGSYLKVGEDWKSALTKSLHDNLGITELKHLQMMGADSYPEITAKEAATFTVFQLFLTSSTSLKPATDCQYTSIKWVGHTRSINECTFSHPLLRSFSLKALDYLNQESEEFTVD